MQDNSSRRQVPTLDFTQVAKNTKKSEIVREIIALDQNANPNAKLNPKTPFMHMGQSSSNQFAANLGAGISNTQLLFDRDKIESTKQLMDFEHFLDKHDFHPIDCKRGKTNNAGSQRSTSSIDNLKKEHTKI